NKRTRALSLKAELRSLKLGDLSIDAYFRKIEFIATILKGLGSPLTNEDVVNIALDGFPTKYDNVYVIIVHREPFWDLKMVSSMLTIKEMQLKSRVQDTFIYSTSSSPMVLLANSDPNARRATPSTEKVNKPCFNFNKGSCRFGEYCKFFHNGVHSNSSLLSSRGSSYNVTSSSNLTQTDLMTLQGLLAKLGCNGSNNNAQPIANQFVSHPIGNNTPMALYSTPTSASVYGLLGASSHLNYYVSSLSDVFNLCIFPSVSVGYMHSIPITNSGHSFVRDNSCIVEFNAFGFSVKDFLTHRVLLRCDSTGDLYPVTKLSNIP
ncbi:ribonuclease H-like domain-containing protein, partial [Tanacetum coccineum]